jgi:predicted methyltransferase
MSSRQPEDPGVELLETAEGEVTLSIAGGQSMQGWEQELMHLSADILCGFGSEFLEAGLGLGLSALRIAGNPGTRRHRVIERYPRVIELFTERHPEIPAALEIVCADWFDFIEKVPPESVDGIFFDPALPTSMWDDTAVWDRLVPAMRRALRMGGALIPFFTTRPYLRWQYLREFDRVLVERRSFCAYGTTRYTAATEGDAFIQCFIRTR